jgi:hypothetical protein
MSEDNRELVSFERFTALLNEELTRRPWYRSGLRFVMVPGGYDFVGVDDDLAKSAWSKEVHDIVSRRYKISRDYSPVDKLVE